MNVDAFKEAGAAMQEAFEPDGEYVYEDTALRALSLLMDACTAETTYAAICCPECEWFRVGLVSGDFDVCGDCGTTLEEKVLTKSTVFSQLERTNARVVDP